MLISVIVAGCDSTELFEFIEEPLDKITFPVKSEVGFPLHCSIAFWRYDRGDPPRRDRRGYLTRELYIGLDYEKVYFVEKKFS